MENIKVSKDEIISKAELGVCAFPARELRLAFHEFTILSSTIGQILQILLVRKHTSQLSLFPLMLRRAVQSALRRPLSTMSTSQTPMEDAIRSKVWG